MLNKTFIATYCLMMIVWGRAIMGTTRVPARVEDFLEVGSRVAAPSSKTSGDDKESNGGNTTNDLMTEESIAGNIKLNNEMYQISCDCTDKWKESLIDEAKGRGNGTECKTPTRFVIERKDQADVDDPISPADVRSFLGRPSAMNFVDVDKTPLHDADGRVRDVALSSPGGDAAQFALACAVYEQMTNQSLDSSQVADLFGDYLIAAKDRRFVFHTTKTAVEQLAEETRAPGLDMGSVKNKALAKYVFGAECRAPAKKPCGLMNPANVGVDQLKLMMKRPGEYLVRAELVLHVLKAVYSTLWNSAKPGHSQIDFQVLNADTFHNEGAVVLVSVSDACKMRGVVPTLAQSSQKVDGGREFSAYVVQMDAVRRRQTELAEYFATKSSGNDVDEGDKSAIDAKAFEGRLDLLSRRALNKFSESLSGTVPVYQVSLE